MDPPSWSTLNHFSHLPANKTSTSESHSNHHRAMANFPALSPPFSRQDASLASFHQGAAHLLLHQSGSHGASGETFINPTTSGLLKAGYSAAGLLPYAAGVSGGQPNLAHSNLFNSFQQKESELNELREGFSRGLHPLSMLATSQSQNAVSRAASDLFASSLHQNPATSGAWHLPSPIPSSSMFGVLPHESVGSKTGEKTRSSKSQVKNHASSGNHASSTITSKTSSFVYGTSPSAGTTAKTVISNDLLSSPTYLPQPQYNSFLNLNEKKEVYDQNNAALDYTSGNAESTVSSQKQNMEGEAFNTDCQRTAKGDSELSHQSPMPHQSPMMASQSPATSHNSPMVSSAVISPVEPPVYSPASNLRYGENSYEITADSNARKYSSSSASHCSSQLTLDQIKSHSSPHGSSLCNHNSPMSTSTAGTGSPFVSESPRESLPAKDYPCVNSNHPSHYGGDQQSMLSPTNCNLTVKENYDLLSQRDEVSRQQQLVSGMDNIFPNSENLDDLSLQEFTSITDNNSRLPCMNQMVDQNPNFKSGNEQMLSPNSDFNTHSSRPGEYNASKRLTGVDSKGNEMQSKRDSLPSEKQYIFRNRMSSERNCDGSETKSKIFSRTGKQGGKPAGFFNSYLSFIKKSPPKGQRKRGRPRKYPVLPSNIGMKIAPKIIKEPKSVEGHVSGNFTFSDSEEEQDTSHNISDTVQLALKTLTDDEMDKTNDKVNSNKAASSNAKLTAKRKVYENFADNSNLETSTMDVYDFDSEFCEPEVQPSSFRFSSQKKKPIRKTSLTLETQVTPPAPLPPVAPIAPITIPNDNAMRKISMRKCVEKLIQKREQRTAKRKKMKRVKSDQSSGEDDDSDDDWIPMNKAAAVLHNESDKSDNDEPESSAQLPNPPQKVKKSKLETNVKKKSRMLRRESADTTNDENRSCTFKTGDFIINMKDMHKEKPCIWRIHGKGLIQKYESFDKDDKVLYQNISSFSSWTDETSNDYLPVNVRFNYSQRGNCVVEYLGPVRTDPKFINQMMIESSQFQAQKENFEVYLQTLISQALDPNFISEIVKENDEYFLSHMLEIDNMAIKRKEKLIEDRSWSESFLQCVQYYPCVNIIASKSLPPGSCQACSQSTCVKLVQFYGQPYDYTTLRRTALSPHSLLSSNKEFMTCDSCSDLVNLYNRLHHQKYNFYIACHTKVNHVRVSSRDMRLESHVILEKCLRDAEWINKMFEEIMSLWLECDRTR